MIIRFVSEDISHLNQFCKIEIKSLQFLDDIRVYDIFFRPPAVKSHTIYIHKSSQYILSWGI